ncbi:MAG TPA: hypothetical protein VIQ74_01885, partial [Gemmatimonadaceae bacterium]
REPRDAAGRTARLASSVGAAALCATVQFALIPRMDRLRTSLEALPMGDPLRSTFGRLHILSVLLVGLAMILALVALMAGVRYIASTRSR